MPNKILVAADYAQLEVRVAAFVSRDPVLMEIMNADPTSFEGDLHARTMYEVFGVPFDKQGGLKHIRVQAKTYFFSVLYGGREDGAIQRRFRSETQPVSHPSGWCWDGGDSAESPPYFFQPVRWVTTNGTDGTTLFG